MKDQIIRASSAEGVRVFTCSTAQIAQTAHEFHRTSPVITAALGRALSGAAMMGIMLKGEKDNISLQWKGDGPAGLLCAVSDASGRVRGSVANANVTLPLNARGKLDVGGAIGKGTLYVLRDLGMKEPYIGQTPIVNGEIAEDLTYYFAASEQIPTAIGLGVLVGTDENVLCSGGFIAQLMPDAEEEIVTRLERNISQLSSVTDLLQDGMSPEDIAAKILEGFTISEKTDCVIPQYYCGCSRDRAEKALISLGQNELSAMIQEDGKAELSCPYCDQLYQFSLEQLQELHSQSTENQEG